MITRSPGSHDPTPNELWLRNVTFEVDDLQAILGRLIILAMVNRTFENSLATSPHGQCHGRTQPGVHQRLFPPQPRAF
jgi:hypothetical protein